VTPYEFFGLTGKPFDLGPDPTFLYLSQSHKEALASAVYSVREGKGFLALIGEPGSGKTTLLEALRTRLERECHLITLPAMPEMTYPDLARAILEKLDFPAVGRWDDTTAVRAIRQQMAEFWVTGRQVVIAIDEAQALSSDTLEKIRLLSNLDPRELSVVPAVRNWGKIRLLAESAPSRGRWVGIILAGQSSLMDRLLLPDLSQLRQRIAIYCRLRPLEGSEVAHYIRCRLGVVGYRGPDLFTPRALDSLSRASEGNPRTLNILCDHALLVGFTRKTRPIPGSVIEAVARNLETQREPRGGLSDPFRGLVTGRREGRGR